MAGVLDGDGNFDIRYIHRVTGASYRALKSIRITQHPRDADILYRVKELIGGSIKPKGGKYVEWRLSTNLAMLNCINCVNGRIRLKTTGFKEACDLMGVTYLEPNYLIEKNSAYLAGLTDTDGSVFINFNSNKIELVIEFKKNEFSEKLDLSQVVPGAIPGVNSFVKRNQTKDKVFYSIRFSFSNVSHMTPIYDYFLINRLYSKLKFFRVMKIKRYLELRPYQKYPKDSPEFQLYLKFVTEFVTYLNEEKPLPKFIQDPHP